VLKVPCVVRSSWSDQLAGHRAGRRRRGPVVRELRTAPGPGGMPRGSHDHCAGHSSENSGVEQHETRKPSSGRGHEELQCVEGTTRAQELPTTTVGRPRTGRRRCRTGSSRALNGTRPRGLAQGLPRPQRGSPVKVFRSGTVQRCGPSLGRSDEELLGAGNATRAPELRSTPAGRLSAGRRHCETGSPCGPNRTRPRTQVQA